MESKMSRELYLGRLTGNGDRLEFDPDELVTHGVILGMTGSGKTGLALGLLEELVEAGVPVIAIDPKGDLPNLALLFPEFNPESFLPWCDPTEAKRTGKSLEGLAQEKAEAWRSGLARWDIDAGMLQNLQNRLDLRVFTPGSTAVKPVNLLGSFKAPSGDLTTDIHGELAEGIVSGLLSLLSDSVDPLRDPRHVLLAQIFHEAWSKDLDLTLEELIGQVVDPPFAKVGVFPVDRFYSPDDRMKLAMQLNNLVASPSFSAWKQGETLDVAGMLQSAPGKAPVNIFSLAHLSEKERHFFVGRLMSEVLTWSRSLPGSGSLRALIYFDEASGYLPPHPYNPPSKGPILTMLKQSRAVGVGVCLATQNPVDLDYKALSNIGTWMIGKLQTQQDRDRVRDGLVSASGGLTAQEVETELSKVKPRTFLLRGPKSSKPILFETRWAMSFLRGPITLSELEKLPLVSELSSQPATPPQTAAPSKSKSSEKRTPPPTPEGFGQSFLDPRYVFHNRLNGFFERFKEPPRENDEILFRPALRALLRLQFDESKDNFVLHQRHHFVAFPIDGGQPVITKFESLPFQDDDFLKSPPPGALFTELPEEFDQKEELKEAQEQLCAHLYRTLTAGRFVNESVKLYSRPDESQEAFLERCAEEAEKLADEAALKLRAKLDKQLERLHKQLARDKGKLERLELTEKSQKVQGLYRAGEMLLNLFSKRRRSFSTVLNSSRRALEADQRTRQAEQDLQRLEGEIVALQDELEEQLDRIETDHENLAGQIEERAVSLDKNDIDVERFEILWIPVSKRL
jgi:hypothetical protein